MRQKSGSRATTSEKVVKDIRRATRKRHSSEEKIRIVLDGLRGEDSIAELERRDPGRPDDHLRGSPGGDVAGLGPGGRSHRLAVF